MYKHKGGTYKYQPRHAVKVKPYQRSKNFGNRPINKQPRKIKPIYLWGALILIILGAIAYWLFLSDSFRIRTIDTTMAQNFSSDDLKNMAWDIAHERHILPADNLFLFNSQKLSEAIAQKYYLHNLKIKIRPPHKLIITFEEQGYNLIWHEADKYYYIDYQGNIIQTKDSADPNITALTNNGSAKLEDRKINIDTKYLQFADQLNRAFDTQIKGLTERELFLDDELNTVKIQIKNGPIIKFNTEEGIDKQLTKLETLRRLELPDGKTFNSKQYIDLRYGDRVFYQ